MCAYFYINTTYICMLMYMYSSRCYELTNDIHVIKQTHLMMCMSFVSYRTKLKIYFECSEDLARDRYTLTVKQTHIFEASL